MFKWDGKVVKQQEFNKSDRTRLSVLIFLGFISLIIFWRWILKPENIGDLYLFIPLIIAFGYKSINTLYEWFLYLGIKQPKIPERKRLFTVDVFTTACPGEPRDMIIKTLKAMVVIKYPHNNYLCDEGNDPVLKKACEELGVKHITRNNRIDAKAGNINNALKYSNGEICLVLDPDHQPSPYILDRVIDYFNDDEIGFIQIVQAYKNQHESLIAKADAEQSYSFYGPLMTGMNSYGVVQAIGANCIFRRKALESIGGHAPGLAEDMHTAMCLYSKGWKSHYIPEILTRGLVPTTLSGYYKRQLKWSCGCFNLLFEKYPSLFKHFTTFQKIHYIMAPIYFLAGFISLIDLSIPVISLTSGLVPFKISLEEFLIHYMPFLISAVLIRQSAQNWFLESSERGFHLLGGISRLGAWWVQMIGFFCALVRIRIPYIPTPKNEESQDSWLMSLPNIAVIFISSFAVIYGLENDYTPYSFFMACFALLNVILLLIFTLISQQRSLNRVISYFSIYRGAIGYLYQLRCFFGMRYQTFLSLCRNYSTVFVPVFFLCFLVLNLKITTSLNISNSFTFTISDIDKLHEELNPDEEKEYGDFMFGYYNSELNDIINSDLSVNSPLYGYVNTQIENYDKNLGHDIKILSFYQPWIPDNQSIFPGMNNWKDMFGKEIIPLINWEPWSETFSQFKDDKNLSSNHKIMVAITEGKFDSYLRKYASRIREYGGPVFIRFAHSMNNPDKHWSQSGDNTPVEFKKAWIYIHNLFQEEAASNVTWVWSPRYSNDMDDYYPGDDYVDWIGLTILNYGNASSDGKWNDFDQIYRDFRFKVLGFKKPVMIAEFGSTGFGGEKSEWINNALDSISKNYHEIKSVVFFESTQDFNWPTAWRQEPKNIEKIQWGFLNNTLKSEFISKAIINITKSNKQKDESKHAISRNLSYGIYFPVSDHIVHANENTDENEFFDKISKAQDQLDINFNIVSLYFPWHPDENFISEKLLNDIWNRGSIPMITWEPWFKYFENKNSDKLFLRITKGEFDDYLKKYAIKFKNLKKPIILRFAHEMDNDFYPWTVKGGNTPDEFINAWRYVHKIFKENGANNVKWLWNPWGPEKIDEYYPGNDYVDIIGLTILNYGYASEWGEWTDFDKLYKPFRDKLLKFNKPIAIAEYGSTNYGGNSAIWIYNSLKSIAENFPEIQSIVFFHSDEDKNWPTEWRPNFIDWSFIETKSMNKEISNEKYFKEDHSKEIGALYNGVEVKDKEQKNSKFIQYNNGKVSLIVDGKPFYVKGVAYNPGHDWRDGNIPLSRRVLENDFKKIKDMGTNTIRRYGKGWYDLNIINIADEYDLKVIYGFYFDPKVDYLKDSKKLEEYENEIRTTVNKYKNSNSILAWDLGNETWGLLKHKYSKPYLNYVRLSYTMFVERMAKVINELDPNHPVFTVHEHTKELPSAMYEFSNYSPSLDFIGVNSYYDHFISNLDNINKKFNKDRPYLVSEFGIDGYWEDYQKYVDESGKSVEIGVRDEFNNLREIPGINKAYKLKNIWDKYVKEYSNYNLGGIAYCWMDRMEGTQTWYGMTDYKGRFTPQYFALKDVWTDDRFPEKMPLIKEITSPVNPVEPGKEITLTLKGNFNEFEDLKFEWEMRKDDILGKVGEFEYGDHGYKVKLIVPKAEGNYRIYAYVSDNNGSVDTASIPIVVEDTFH